ncbi:MAG: hypothetical protein ABRQ31_07600 [Smithellaceae bacterium]|jgi:hypothetical protein
MTKKFMPVITGFLLIILLAAVSAEAKSIFKIGGDVFVKPDQTVDSVIDIGGQVTVQGLVEQDVIAVGGSIVLANESIVRGDVICVGGVVVRGNDAQVFGDITEINAENISSAVSSALRGDLEGWSLILNIISLCFFAVIFIIALIMVFFIPRPLIFIVREIQTYKVKSFLWGFLATLTIAPFFMLLTISIIGITLIPLIFTLLLLAFILGYIASGKILGAFVLTKISRRQAKSLAGETILGLILLWLVGWIPYIGWLIKFFALTFGLGGVLLALFNRKNLPAAPPPSPVNNEPVQPVNA